MKIPVIGNGDIFEPQDAKRMLEETGCDGLMVGRGARGNPWIFERINHYLETGEVLPPPGPVEVGEMILRHTRMHVALKGEMRKHIAWYTAGLPHSSAIRRDCNMLETEAELVELLRQHRMLQ